MGRVAMKDVLAAESDQVLSQFASSHVLLAFDFDGTLAPIVADRSAASMRTETRVLLDRVCKLYPCAVITGRALIDIRGRLCGLPLNHVIGNHGLEPSDDAAKFQHQVASVRPELEAALEGFPGVDIEDKSLSLAVHYRRSRSRKEARRAIYDAVGGLASMRVVPGKLVVNVVPGGAPHKGDAVVRLRAQEGSDTAIYVGDDVTDEDVFELDQPGRLLSVRVGRSAASAADYFLRDQRQIDPFLSRLAELRNGSPGCARTGPDRAA